MKVSAIMLGSFYFIVCSTEFVEEGAVFMRQRLFIILKGYTYLFLDA